MAVHHIVIVGSGIGGLSAAALLAQSGYKVTVLEAQTYPGGCASTFTHKGYRFDAGATVAGGFQPNGPHHLIGEQLGIEWPIRLHDPAWVVHLPDTEVALTRDNADVLQRFPKSEKFWEHQSKIADLGWTLASRSLPWPPTHLAELLQLARTGLAYFPNDLLLLPLAFRTAYQWVNQYGLAQDTRFLRFIDAQLLISAQTTSQRANAIYSATALDLARQGVYHVVGGIGALAETLVNKIRAFGGEVIYRRRVTRLGVENGRVTGVYFTEGRRAQDETFLPADFVLANLTPASLDELLGDHSPAKLRREVQSRQPGWGAFALHLGVRADALPQGLPDHHQIITNYDEPLGEGRSLFMSMSPKWDSTRAPAGYRAVTVTTHTPVQAWWDALAEGEDGYQARKQAYAESMLTAIEKVLPGFRSGVSLMLPGSPVTYQFYTDRHLGMVGGFPQQSLLNARGPRTGLPNLRLVGDSIFPGQSTAGVTAGAMRVVRDVLRTLPKQAIFGSSGAHYKLQEQTPGTD